MGIKGLIEQIFKFGIVGIICFLIDYCLMIGLTEGFEINYLISSGISFSVSVVVNYILSLKFVFKAKESVNKAMEFTVFVVLSLLGLGLNQILMWMCVDILNIFYMIAKIGVTGIVMVYNFITRKVFLEGKQNTATEGI